MAENVLNEDQLQKGKAKRGFASMSPDKQREIAGKGGRAAHEQGVAHKWSSEEARIAGKKGGQVRGTSKLDNTAKA